ncbi:MAG TPA: SPFH domain-containing protein [Anaerolineales bacterium]|nr:SPFH domain-containing protein [Anaerolineales bacterium]
MVIPKKLLRRILWGIPIALILGLWLWFGYLTQIRDCLRPPDAFGILSESPTACVALFRTLAIDVVAVAFVFWGGTALLSQFALPVQKYSDRKKAWEQFREYVVGNIGPVRFIQNGKVVERYKEEERHGSGVMFLDSASGVGLQTNTQFVGTYGPGIVFTRPGEQTKPPILDLRKQKRSIDDVSALTKDGFQITANISVEFMLARGVDEAGNYRARKDAKDWHFPGPPFHFDKSAAFQAIYGSVVTQTKESPWYELPVLVAIDVWRELIANHTSLELLPDLDQLYSQREVDVSQRPPASVERIRAELRKRLSGELDFNVLPTTPRPSETYILHKRGIRVLNVGVSNIRFAEQIDAEFRKQWEAWFSELVKNGFKSKNLFDALRDEASKKAREKILVSTLDVITENHKRVSYNIGSLAYDLLQQSLEVSNLAEDELAKQTRSKVGNLLNRLDAE